MIRRFLRQHVARQVQRLELAVGLQLLHDEGHKRRRLFHGFQAEVFDALLQVVVFYAFDELGADLVLRK